MESRTIELEINDWKRARSPDIIYSGGLGSCIAIAIHNPMTSTGYMIHDSGPDQMNITPEFIEMIKEENPDLSFLRAFIAGGDSYFPLNYLGLGQDCLKSRKFVENAMADIFTPDQYEIHWSPANHMAELYLNTRTGKFTHIVEDILDLDLLLDSQNFPQPL